MGVKVVVAMREVKGAEMVGFGGAGMGKKLMVEVREDTG